MSAFVIVDVKVTDPVRYEDYKHLAAPTVAEFGGRYVVRGGAAEVLEGDSSPGRVVVLEFPTAERAKDWWSSDSYAEAKAIRYASATSTMILVEGV